MQLIKKVIRYTVQSRVYNPYTWTTFVVVLLKIFPVHSRIASRSVTGHHFLRATQQIPTVFITSSAVRGRFFIYRKNRQFFAHAALTLETFRRAWRSSKFPPSPTQYIIIIIIITRGATSLCSSDVRPCPFTVHRLLDAPIRTIDQCDFSVPVVFVRKYKAVETDFSVSIVCARIVPVRCRTIYRAEFRACNVTGWLFISLETLVLQPLQRAW